MPFYRIIDHNGYKFVVTPNNEPVFISGVNHIGDGSIYPLELKKRFGSRKEWRRSVANNIRRWKFHALGPAPAAHAPANHQLAPEDYQSQLIVTSDWTPEEYAELDIPFFYMIQLPGYEEMKPWTFQGDLFSDEFARSIDERCRYPCSQLRENPNLIGYFFCHNPPWSIFSYGFEGCCADWISTLLQPPNTPARHQWKLLMQRLYGSLECYSQVYAPIESFDDILTMPYPLRGIGSAAKMREDMRAFSILMAERWYSLWHQAIRRYDPYHLICGDRLTAHRSVIPEYILPVMDPYIDLLAVNMMAPPQQTMENLRSTFMVWEKPILIADCGARPYDGQLKSGHWVKSDRDVGRFLRAHYELAIQHPSLVGLLWCGYWETSVAHSGICHWITGQPNAKLVRAFSRHNHWVQLALKEHLHNLGYPISSP
ncbi:MAG: hypothetical protein D6820_06105 [Lentisphaerae bacterium]|nr:MAG: hypothetical protein D6820_06105 [Lentisphaerota bacterium]